MSLCCILYISWVLIIIYPVGKLLDSNKNTFILDERNQKIDYKNNNHK